MANIQLYTGDNSYYSSEQITELNKPLNPQLVSTRSNGNTKLRYIEGHTAIDQANRIFGYGNWSYRPLSCEQVVLIDPLTGEAVGIEYKAMVELMVRGAIGPIVDIGSQPVSTWNVEDQIMGRRVNDAKYNKKPVDEGPFTPLEKKNARAVIVDAHEAAKKGAVTDALKRALRAFGNQFGNELYGKDHPQVFVSEESTVESTRTSTPRQLPAPQASTVESGVESTPSKSAPSGQEVYARGKQKGVWKSSSEFFATASHELGVAIGPNTVLSVEERIALLKLIDDTAEQVA